MTRRPTWLLVATGLTILWAAVIVALVTNALLRSPSFEAAAAEPCGQFLVPLVAPLERTLRSVDPRLHFPLVRWRDMKSGDHISSFRRGERVLSCAVLEQRASVFLEAHRRCLISPKLVVHKRGLALLIGLPACLFVIVCYLGLHGRHELAPRRSRQPNRLLNTDPKQRRAAPPPRPGHR